MSSETDLPTTTPHPVTAPSIAPDSTTEPIRDASRKGDYRVTDNTPRITRSWNELRDEATAISLVVVDAGDANATFRITAKNHDKERASSTRKVLNDLIEHGGTVRILGPAGSEEGVRQS